MITARETRERLRADRDRLREVLRSDPARSGGWLALDPSWHAVWLHRWSHYCFARGHRLRARFLWHVNLMLTGTDVSPLCDFGPGLVIVEPLACILLGKSGRNLTVRAHASFGGGMSREDIGAGPGLPLLGDDVELDLGSVILGPLRIGSRSYVGPRCVVHTHLAEDSRVLPPAPRIRAPGASRAELEVVNG